ncbi:MAG: O-antigen ligase family protein [Bacillota bacterium]
MNEDRVSLSALALMLGINLLALFDGGFDHQVMYWVLFILTGLTLLALKNSPKQIFLSFSLDNPFVWFLLYLFWCGLSIFWSLNPHRTLVEFLQLSCYGLVFLNASQLNNDDIYRVGRIVIFTAVGISLLGIFQYGFVDANRIQGTFTNPNPFGIYLVMIFLLAWGYSIKYNSIALIVSSLFLAVALILTGSRGSFIALLIVFPIIFIGLNRKEILRSLIKTTIFFMITLLIVKILMLASPYIQDKNIPPELIKSTIRTSSLSSSTEGRLAFWETGKFLFANKPFTGYGLGSFYLAYYLSPMDDKWYSRFVHNHYIQTAVETGIVGLILLTAFFISVLIKAKKNYKKGCFPGNFTNIMAASLAFLFHIGMDFSWNFPGATVIFFASAGILSNLNYTNRTAYRFNKIITFIGILFILVLNIWQFSAIKIYMKGIDETNTGQYKKAAESYNLANAFYPINPQGYAFEGKQNLYLYISHNDREYLKQALANLEKAVKLSPQDAMLHNQLGNIYVLLDDGENAEKHFILSIELRGRLIAYLNLGKLYFRQSDLEKAKEIFLSGIKEQGIAISQALDQKQVSNQAVELHLLVAEIYKREGNPMQVEHHLREARKLNAEHPIIKQYFNNEEI